MTVPQIICPFCHSRQPNAWDCAVCGRALHERPTSQGLQVAPLPELELHRQADVGDVPDAPVDGLELTALADGSGGDAAALEGLEPTLLDDGGNVALPQDPSLEIEHTQLDDGPMKLAPGPVICRYCGTPWRDGSSIFCARCAMRII